MSDQRQRELERSGNRVTVLRMRVRSRLLAAERIQLAASLGDEAAMLLYPDVIAVDWTIWRLRVGVISAALILLGKTLPARVATDWAEHSGPKDPMVLKALAATRNWINCPCKKHQKAVNSTIRAWDSGADSAGSADQSIAAIYAASAADYGYTDYTDTVDAAADAADAANYAANNSADYIWQKQRLAYYLLEPSKC